MEKKTKKLQLRKETIAVLNGERMTHVVGGNGVGCQINGRFYNNGEVIVNDGAKCVCMNGNWECQPMDGFTGGCTDGCTGSGVTATAWNCTEQDCTADCRTIVCDTNEFCTL